MDVVINILAGLVTIIGGIFGIFGFFKRKKEKSENISKVISPEKKMISP